MTIATIRVDTRNTSEGTDMTSRASISSEMRMAPISAVNDEPTCAASAIAAMIGVISRVLM